MSTWLLVANASEARLYTTNENPRLGNWQSTKEFTHPESRQKGADLISDRHGHYQHSTRREGAFEESDLRQVEAERFARELGQDLKAGLNSPACDQLIVIAPAQFYGRLKSYLNHEGKLKSIKKDYTKFTEKVLAELVKKRLWE